MTGRPDQRIRVGACLSLSGRYARFGTQAARALEVWRSLDGHADLVIEDDRSDPQALSRTLPRVAAAADVLLSPYSTQLVKAAAAMASAEGWLLWNHGGSGDDLENSHAGHVVSLLTPASRYPEPFIRCVLSRKDVGLWIVYGEGSFGRQVAAGAYPGRSRPDPRSRRRESRPRRDIAPPVRTRPSPGDVHDVVFFRRHREDDPGQAVPGRKFLNSCPVKVRATMRAVLAQVAAAPPKKVRRRWLLGGDKGRHDGVVRGPRQRAQAASLPAVLPSRLRRQGPAQTLTGGHLRAGQAVPDATAGFV